VVSVVLVTNRRWRRRAGLYGLWKACTSVPVSL
jgi:hypothetical protein